MEEDNTLAQERHDRSDAAVSLQDSPPPAYSPQHSTGEPSHNSQEGYTMHNSGELTDNFPQFPHDVKEESLQHSLREPAHQSQQQQLPESPSEERMQHFQGESTHHSPKPTPEHSSAETTHDLSQVPSEESIEHFQGVSTHDSRKPTLEHSPAESTHGISQGSPRHSPPHSVWQSPIEPSDQPTPGAPHSSRKHSPQHSPAEFAHHPSPESPRHSSQQCPLEPPHISTPHSSQRPQQHFPLDSPRDSPQHSPLEAPHHSTGDSPQSPEHPRRGTSFTRHNVPQHSSINVETSTSHGEHDEDEVFHDAQWSVRDSIFSALSDIATSALDLILPPLPPEPPPSDVSPTRPSALHSHDELDSRAPRRSVLDVLDVAGGSYKLGYMVVISMLSLPMIIGHVAFAGAHDEGEVSTASFHEVVRESADKKARLSRPRALSTRFLPIPMYPQHKEHTLCQLFFIAYQTLGVVYGDLGTSPLYVYPTIHFTSPPTEQDFLGILSLIFWTLTLIGVLKYTLIVLQADDHGEGGTFALYSSLCQHANIGQHQGEESPVQDRQGRRLSHMYNLEEGHKYSKTKDFLENNRSAQKILLFFVMMGTCMIIGDGILTPAISVISAIEGIQIAAPNLGRAIIVIISAVILVLLFLMQRFGTHRVSLFFSPVMTIWFITTPLVGVYNIVIHYPKIFKAISPTHIYYFFKAKGKEAWMMLGGTVLCITGAEAMFADMGHFNKRSIQIAFCLMVYPSVLLTYSGQTSYLIKHPEDHGQGFFKMIPQKVFWPMFVISTLAAIVASQGLISATFSIIKQSVALDYFPRVKLVHTSEDKEGQIYSPEVNYILMLLCLGVVFGFRSSATIGNAFGVAVVCVMMITTCLMTLVMLVIWECRVVATVAFFLLFICVEGVYISSVVTKVPQGGWLPFAVALVVTLIMFTWNMGCQAKYRYEVRNQITKYSFNNLLHEAGGVRVPGICFFLTDLMSGVPPVVQHYVSNVRSLHRVLVFTTVRFLPVKTVLPSERFLVGRAGFDGVYRCVARYGYRDAVKIQNDEFLDQFLATLTEYIECREDFSRRESMLLDNGEFHHTPTAAEISMLQQAGEDGAVYVMGRGDMKVSKKNRFTTRFFVGTIYRFLRANCRSEVSAMDIPHANYLEIGMLYEL